MQNPFAQLLHELSARQQHEPPTRGAKGPCGAWPLQLGLAVLSLPALSVLHRHNIISAHSHRFLPVCSHKSPRRARTSQLRCGEQHRSTRNSHGKPDKNNEATQSPKKSKTKMLSCFLRPQQPSGAGKEVINPKIGAHDFREPLPAWY